MNFVSKRSKHIEIAIPIACALVLLVSCAMLFQRIASHRERLRHAGWLAVGDPVHAVLAHAGPGGRIEPVPKDIDGLAGLLTGGLRVAAIGSAYPIPYDAEVCPFSGIPQPAINQLDRDGDGITDDWELKFGLDRYNAGDAVMDADSDGFSNKEEFQAATAPNNSQSHPPYAEKLRFVERKTIPFPYVFQGITELSDGRMVFQLNSPSDGKSYFVSIGDRLEDIVVERFIPKSNGRAAVLYVRRADTIIELERGCETADPESRAELINILDQSIEIVTMGALLSLYDNTYTVLAVHADKVVLKDVETGGVYDILRLAEGE